MAIALGRSLTHPTYVLAQIVYVVSLFLLLLGCARVAVDATGLMWRLLRRADGGTQSVTLASLRCFHVSVTSLFTAYPSHVQRSSSSSSTATTTTTTTTAAPAPRVVMSQDGAGLFLLTHAVAAVLLAHPLSVLLQRRKVVLDFVATLYAVYMVLSCVAVRRVPPHNTLSWLFALLCGACTLTAMTWYMCRRRELQYVSLSSDMTGVGSDAHVASGGSSSAAVHGASGASHGVHAPSSSTMTMAAAASSPAYAAVAGNAVLGGGGVGIATVAGHAGATAGGAGVGHGSNAAVTPVAAVPTALSPRAQRLEHAAGVTNTADVVEMEQRSSPPPPPPTMMTATGDDGRWHVRTAAATHAASSTLPTTGETASGVAARGAHGMLHHMGGVAMPGYAAKRKTN